MLSALGLALAACSTAPKGTVERDRVAHLGTNHVHYVIVGQGPQTIVFVHGWSCNEQFWREQVPALEEHARLILVDLPGHGQSDKPQTDYSMDFFARGVLAVMDDAKVSKATLVGHSMGTPVICRVYAQSPGRVAGLVAVDGIMRRPPMSPEQAAQFVARFSGADYREQVKKFVASMYPNPGTEALRDWSETQVLLTPQYVMSSAMLQMFDANKPDWAPSKVEVPVIVLNAKSPMWTADYETWARGLSPKSDYRVISGTGHFLMLEKPAEFNAQLLAMLQEFGLCH